MICQTQILNKKRGFTLLEVLLAIAIAGMIGAIGAPILISEQTRNELDIAADGLSEALRRAQTLSQQAQNDSSWGVYVATSTVTVFSGDDYASRDSSLDENLAIASNIVVSGESEYVFSKLAGELGSAGTTTLATVSGEIRQVVINEKGTVMTKVSVTNNP